MQKATNSMPANLEKYRPVPRPKVPIEDDEIRVSMNGRMPRYVIYAASLFTEKQKKKISIKATGNAVSLAITLAEVLKRRFENLHQVNVIGLTRSVDTFEPLEEGLDQVVHERFVPFIEIHIATEPELLDQASKGYQGPIDQNLVKPFTAENQAVKRPSRYNNYEKGEGPRRPRNDSTNGETTQNNGGNYEGQYQDENPPNHRGSGYRGGPVRRGGGFRGGRGGRRPRNSVSST